MEGEEGVNPVGSKEASGQYMSRFGYHRGAIAWLDRGPSRTSCTLRPPGVAQLVCSTCSALCSTSSRFPLRTSSAHVRSHCIYAGRLDSYNPQASMSRTETTSIPARSPSVSNLTSPSDATIKPSVSETVTSSTPAPVTDKPASTPEQTVKQTEKVVDAVDSSEVPKVWQLHALPSRSFIVCKGIATGRNNRYGAIQPDPRTRR